MADTKTSDEIAATVLTGAELVRVVQSSTSKRTTAGLLGHQFRGCRIEKTTTLTAQNVTAGAAISFQAAVLDSDTFWSAGSPTRATITAAKGFKVANVTASVRLDNQTADTWTLVNVRHSNSSAVVQRTAGTKSEVGTTTVNITATMANVPLTDGDFFDVFIQTESDTSVDIHSTCSLCVEIIGMEP
jgi:hypothetical protein